MPRTYNLVRTIVVVALFEFSVMPSLLSQEKPAEPSIAEPSIPSIKAQSVNVVVDLIVTDRHGHHVPGLTASDFTIYEDGVAQKIVGFTPAAGSASNTSSPLAAPRTGEVPKTAPQQGPAALSSEPHLLTVVLDLADNRPANTKSSSDAVLGYLDKTLGSGDYVSIFYIDQGLHMALPFTNDLQKARETLKRIETRRSTGTFSGSDRATTQSEINDLYREAHPETALGAIAGEQPPVTAGPGGPPSGNNLAMIMDRQIDAMRSYLTMANMFQARAVFAALRAICFAYRDLPGRKNVVLFSEGFLYSDDARPAMEAVADAANRANVSIYVIDPQGVEVNPYGAGDRPTDTITSQMAAAGAPGANVGQHGGETKFDKIKTVGNFSRGDQLEWLADTTGGFMVKRTNDLLPAFNKVMDDAHDYYTLSYVPGKKEFDGKFHAIKVETSQHSYQLRYRKGYWAIPRGQAVAMSPAAAQVIAGFRNGSLKSSSTPDVHANLLLAPSGEYSVPVSVSIPGNRIPLEKEGDGYKARMTVILVARDSRENLLSVSQRDWNVRFNNTQREDFEKTTVTVRDQLQTTGLQSLNIEAILQLSGNEFARGGTTVQIPDAAGSGFRLTSILLSNRAEPATCSDTADSLCFMNVRLYQPLTAKFTSSGRLIVYFAASDLSLDPQTKKPRLGVAFTLKSGNDVVKSAVAENIQSLSGPVPDSVLVLAEYDLKSLHPGSFTLQVVAKDFVRNTSLSEQSQFAVE
jgi:VWFA-related protein